MRVINAPAPAAVDSAIEIVRLIADPAKAEELLQELRVVTSEHLAAFASITGREDALAARVAALQASEADFAARIAVLTRDRSALDQGHLELDAGRSRYASELANLESQKQHAAQLIDQARETAQAFEAHRIERSEALDAREKALAESEAQLAARLQRLREI